MGYPIPEKSKSAYLVGKAKVQNPGLLFNRFAPSYSDPDAGNWKADALKKVIESNRNIDEELLQAHVSRWNRVVKAAGASSFKMKTSWRFITGLGAKGIYEIGFTFDKYGFPYLPGSSVKGIARAAALLLGDLAEDSPDFISIFGEEAKQGDNGRAGNGIFFDAIPTHKPQIKLDVMNPHHSKYYSGDNKYPVTWEDPIPIFFLTVAPGQEFSFAIGWRKGVTKKKLVENAIKYLKAGLEELGAGAKTGAGYGYWE